jgi:hypothetical protein
MPNGFSRVALLAGVGTLDPVASDVMDALEKIEIAAAIGERGSFRMSFRLDPGSTLPGRFLLQSGDLVRVVVMTDQADQLVAMDGVIVTHSVSAGGNDAGLVLGGEDLTLLMDLIDLGGRSFPGLNVEARVRVILAGYAPRGVTPLVVPPPVPDVAPPSKRIFHQQGTDYAYLRSLARSAGYRFTLDPGPAPGASVAYWGPEPRGDRSHPSLVISFGGPGNVAALRLQFDAMDPVAPQALILDPASKALIPIPAPNISALGPPLGAVVPPPRRLRRLHGTAKLEPAQAAGALLAEAARSAEAMTGLGTLNVVPGQRRLRPGDVVEVRGAADPYDGLFAVSRVRDTITAQDHRQEFQLVRAGLGIAGGGTT